MRKRDYNALHDINVTNLVDVVLVLLIIFMIAAPMMQAGIEVNLPKSKAGQEDLGEAVVITVTKERRIFIDDVVIRMEKFEQKLAEAKARKKAKGVYLRADQSVPYGLVVEVIGKIKAMGIENLGLVTQPAEK